MVGNTYTLMFSFGSGVVIDGTGILMNNNMGNFTLRADIPDAFGLMGSENNLIRPNRRPVSSMSPVMVSRDGQPILMTGSPGGSKIISAYIADGFKRPRVRHEHRRCCGGSTYSSPVETRRPGGLRAALVPTL